MKKYIDTVLKNKAVTIFLAVFVVALFFGWLGD
jgi:hypothetical protein